jgi:hypothetical protein
VRVRDNISKLVVDIMSSAQSKMDFLSGAIFDNGVGNGMGIS